MRSFALLRALKAFTAEKLHSDLPGVGIYVGGLPYDDEDAYPFAVLRLAEGSCQEGPQSCECTDKVLIHVGVREPKSLEEGTFDCVSVCDVLRTALWRERILDERYELEEVRVVLPDPERKQHEYHLLTLVTAWSYHVPPRNAGNDYRDEQFVHTKE